MSVEDYVHKELLTGRRGGFARALGEAWCVADSENRELLEDSFYDTFRPKVHRRFSVVVDALFNQGSPLAVKPDEELAAWIKDRCRFHSVTLLKGGHP